MPKLKVPQPHVPVDRAELEAMQVVLGERCGSCNTPRVGAGCYCERSHLYWKDLMAAVMFANGAITSLNEDPKRANKAAHGLAVGACYRVARHFGFTLPDNFGASMKAHYGVEPRFSAPRRYEQNHLPA